MKWEIRKKERGFEINDVIFDIYSKREVKSKKFSQKVKNKRQRDGKQERKIRKTDQCCNSGKK